jgi:ABC-type transporter Mla MlaB component
MLPAQAAKLEPHVRQLLTGHVLEVHEGAAVVAGELSQAVVVGMWSQVVVAGELSQAVVANMWSQVVVGSDVGSHV